MKEGFFVRPQIKQPFEDHNCSKKLNAVERRAWETSGNVCRTLIGDEKAEECSDIMQELFSSYSVLGCIT
jgi:hypothetical protein